MKKTIPSTFIVSSLTVIPMVSRLSSFSIAVNPSSVNHDEIDYLVAQIKSEASINDSIFNKTVAKAFSSDDQETTAKIAEILSANDEWSSEYNPDLTNTVTNNEVNGDITLYYKDCYSSRSWR